MALVAPRALLVLGNPDYEWLADESGYVSCRAAHEVWKTFGIGDRFGFSIVGGHGHCRLPDSQKPEVEAFVNKFLLGDTSANTEVQTHSFDKVNHRQWYDGWLTGTSTFPVPDTSNIASSFYEVECGTRGSDWVTHHDNEASNGAYVAIRDGLNSTADAPENAKGILTIPFSVARTDTYYVFGRVNCASADDDSFWIKVDNADFNPANGLRTTGWDWVKMDKLTLTKGNHTLTIGYREDGAQLDKIGITTYLYGPSDRGEKAVNHCED